MRYADDWEKIIGRLGRWIDFKNDYKTLYPWYMESIWSDFCLSLLINLRFVPPNYMNMDFYLLFSSVSFF